MSPVVVLIGAPGAGKSTVGPLVAQQLGLEFTDTDQLIESREGRTVPEIFIDSGEDYFREIEREVVAAALDSSTGVLSLGGGAIMDEQTRDRLAEQFTVWLRVNGENAARRVGMNVPRPMLLGNVRARLNSLLKEREELYSAAADAVVVTDNESVEAVVAAVLAEVPGAASSTSDDAVIADGQSPTEDEQTEDKQ